MKPIHRMGAEKSAATDAAARSITANKNNAQAAKTQRLKAARLEKEAALDEALDESFPASDPVEIGHSNHVGQPRQLRKKGHLAK